MTVRFRPLATLTTVLTTALVGGLAATLAAQEGQGPPKPAPELNKFDQLIGTWDGTGTMKMAPDAQSANWTAHLAWQRILDDHCVQEDVHVTGDGMPSPLHMRSTYAYDRVNGRYVTFAISNTGDVAVDDVAWQGDALVAMGKTWESGKPVLFRSITKVTGDGKLSYELGKVTADGQWFASVQGTFTRKTDKPAEVAAVNASFHGKPNPPEMQRLAPWIGRWKVEGEMAPAPGADEVDIMGTQVITALYGGQILQSTIDGKAEGSERPYKAVAYLGFDPRMHRYVEVFADNMGEFGAAHGSWVDDTMFVMTTHYQYMNKPAVRRSILRVGEKGQPVSSTSTMILGSGDAEQVFESSYEKAE